MLEYLPVSHRPAMRRKLQAAYQQPTYEKEVVFAQAPQRAGPSNPRWSRRAGFR